MTNIKALFVYHILGASRKNLAHMRSTLQGKAPCLQHMVKSIAVYEMRVSPLQEWRFFAWQGSWQINELSCFSIALVFLVIYAKPKTMITLSLHRWLASYSTWHETVFSSWCVAIMCMLCQTLNLSSVHTMLGDVDKRRACCTRTWLKPFGYMILK